MMTGKLMTACLAAVMVWGAAVPFTAERSGCVITANAETIVASGTCGAALNWQLDSAGTLTISGTGAMNDWGYDDRWTSYTKRPWEDYADSIKTVEIKDGVTNIGAFAFYDYENLTSVSIPSSVKRINKLAFCGCTSLFSINSLDSVTYFEERALMNTLWLAYEIEKK